MPNDNFSAKENGQLLLLKLAMKSELRELASSIIKSAFPEATIGTGNFTQKEIIQNGDDESVLYDQSFVYKDVSLALRAIRKNEEASFIVFRTTNANLEQVEITDLDDLKNIVTRNFCNFAEKLYEHLSPRDKTMPIPRIDLFQWPQTKLVCTYKGCSLSGVFESDGKSSVAIEYADKYSNKVGTIDTIADIMRMDKFADLIDHKIEELGISTENDPNGAPCDFCELGKEVTSVFDPCELDLYTMRFSKETGEVTIKDNERKGVFKFPKCPFCGKPLGKPTEQQA